MIRCRLQFTLRVCLVAITVVTVALFAAVRHWTKPYAITGAYPNGQVAYEQWERRTLTGQVEHIKTLRWFPNGKRAYESGAGASGAVYWGLGGERYDGTDRAAVTEWSKKYGHLIHDASQPTERPYNDFLHWWNGW